MGWSEVSKPRETEMHLRPMIARRIAFVSCTVVVSSVKITYCVADLELNVIHKFTLQVLSNGLKNLHGDPVRLNAHVALFELFMDHLLSHEAHNIPEAALNADGNVEDGGADLELLSGLFDDARGVDPRMVRSITRIPGDMVADRP